MSPLEKAARAIYEARAKRHGFTVSWEQAGIVDQDRARHDARAVIASIEPDDATVEVALTNYFAPNEPWHSGLPTDWASDVEGHMRSALKAGLRALMAEGEKG